MAGPWRKAETWHDTGPESALLERAEPAQPERLLNLDLPSWDLTRSSQGYVVTLIGADDYYERIDLKPTGSDGWESGELARNAAASILRRLANEIEGVET